MACGGLSLIVLCGGFFLFSVGLDIVGEAGLEGLGTSLGGVEQCPATCYLPSRVAAALIVSLNWQP